MEDQPLNEGWGFCPTDARGGDRGCGYVSSLNEGWGFCLTDADGGGRDVLVALERSTKGGASAPPTPGSLSVGDLPDPPLNEGWGFCPTDA